MTAKEWTTACPDWESRIVSGQSLIPFSPLFGDTAEFQTAREVFRDLRIVDAPGSPTFSVVGRPWALEFADAIPGSYDPETGRRLIREFFLCISKKNSKSTLAAGIMITALARNWRKSAEFLVLAPTIEVANNSFYPARDMVRADPQLRDLCHIQEHYRTITFKETGATLKVVAADNEAVGGKKAVGVLVDELWLFGKRANAEGMLREAMGGLASRPEGFAIYLSTQSDDPPAGVFKQKLQYARDVRDGRISDKRFLPVLYEFPKAMAESGRCRDKSLFYVTNPNIGASVDVEFLEREYDKADAAGESSLRGFLSKHLNVEIGLALRSDRWTGAEFWSKQADSSMTLESLLDRCEAVVVGVDGGGLDDLFGLAVLGRERETKSWLCWAHAWAHVGVLDRRKSIASVLRDFEAAGELTIVDDELHDVSQIVEIIADIDRRGLLALVSVDPAGIGEFVDALAGIGVTQENKKLIGAPQGYGMMNAIKTTERKLANGTLVHSGASIMAWAVSNLKIEPTATAIRATKQNAGDAKIDPVMALFDAAVGMMQNPETTSIYEERGLVFV